MTRPVAIIALIAMTSTAFAQPVEYVCPHVDEAPVLDASLDDACWERATEGLEVLYDRFVVTNDLGYEPEGTVDFLVEPREE